MIESGQPGRREAATVQVWRVRLDVPDGRESACRRLLSRSERDRADRFVHARDRRAFTVTRATLRELLGRWLGRDPGELRFEPGRHGKPRLADGAGPSFNVSHSGAVGLCAVASAGEVGVDVQQVRGDVGIERIAAAVFSADERSRLRPDGFFAAWVRKEALLKAMGRGLCGDPRRVSAGLTDATAPDGWTVREIGVGVGYRAAVAVSLPRVRLVVADRPGSAAGHPISPEFAPSP